MERAIQELKMLLLANKDITKYGDGYEKAMLQAIDVCEKNNINAPSPHLPLGDVKNIPVDHIDAEMVKRWYQKLVGAGEGEMKKDIEAMSRAADWLKVVDSKDLNCSHTHKTKIGFGISDSICDDCGERIKQTVI